MRSRRVNLIGVVVLVATTIFFSLYVRATRTSRDPHRPLTYLTPAGRPGAAFFLLLLNQAAGHRLHSRDVSDDPVADWEQRFASSEHVAEQPFGDYIAHSPGEPAVLTSARGVHGVVVGSHVDPEGTSFLEVVTRDDRLAAVRADDLVQSGVERVWVYRSRIVNDVPIGPARVSVDEDWHSVGMVPPEERVTASFCVTNTGDVPVVAERIRTSCGCVYATPKDGFLLEPRESKTIVVELSRSASGPFHERIAVPIRAEGEATAEDRHGRFVGASSPPRDRAAERKLAQSSRGAVEFHVLGFVHSYARAYPSSLDFGRVVQGDQRTVTRQFTLAETRDDRFTILSISPSQPSVSVSAAQSRLPRNLTRWDFHVEWDPSKVEPSVLEGEIALHTTSALRPTIAVPFTAEVVREYTAVHNRPSDRFVWDGELIR